jgi:hypothetical protein
MTEKPQDTSRSRWRLDWVMPGLGLSGSVPTQVVPRLAGEHGVRHVVDCREEACDDAALLASHGVSLLHLPTPDHQPLSPRRLEEGVAWVSERLARGEGVLIHCQWGIGRSAMLALCVLVHHGRTPLEALEQAKAARSAVCPGRSQLRAYLTWCEGWRTHHRAHWALPSLEALEKAAAGPLWDALKWPP